MALLDSFYGDTPSYLGGLLGEDELRRLQGQAQSQSNLGLATALLRAGAPSRTPGGGALAIAEGLQMGQDTYRKALNQGLQEKMQGLQVNELIRKQQESEAVRRFLPQLIQPGAAELNFSGAPEEISQYFQTPGQGVLPMQQAPSTINRDALQRLALAAPEQFARIAPSLKAMHPEYKEAGGMLYEIPAYGGAPTAVGGSGKISYQDLGNVVVALDASGKEVGRMPKGSVPSDKISYQDLGNVVVALDASGKEVGRMAKGSAPSGPTSLQTIETENGFATFNPKTGQISPLLAGGQPVKGKGAGNLTEGQGSSVAYGMRMAQADAVLKPIEAQGLKDTVFIRAGVSGTLGAVPLIGEALAKGSDNIFNTLPSVLGGLNERQQQTIQARVNFITAVLRKESGASISPTEFATAEKNYFPAPGDSEKVVKQKQQAREMSINAMKIQAGPGAKFIQPQGQGEWEVVK